MSKEEDPKDSKPSEVKKEVPPHAKFIISGLGAMGAQIIVQPIDLIKNRMQVSGELGAKRDHVTSAHAIRNIFRNEGFLGFYNGLSPNLLRQGTYATTRMGLYQVGTEKLTSMGYPKLASQILVAMGAGGFAAFLATPTDVATIRMATDGRLPPNERRNYRHAFDAFARIWREEGVDGLWKGGQATVIRAIVANVAQLVSYSQAKQFFLQKAQMKDNFQCHVVSSLVSGLVYATLTNPLDMAKTRIQTMKSKDGRPSYTGMLDVWAKTVRSEGVLALWKGYVPYYVRIAPTTMLLFVFVERLTILYKEKILGSSD